MKFREIKEIKDEAVYVSCNLNAPKEIGESNYPMPPKEIGESICVAPEAPKWIGEN